MDSDMHTMECDIILLASGQRTAHTYVHKHHSTIKHPSQYRVRTTPSAASPLFELLRHHTVSFCLPLCVHICVHFCVRDVWLPCTDNRPCMTSTMQCCALMP